MNSERVKWWQALNPAIYLISILPAVAVVILAGQTTLWIEGLTAATLAVVLLQHSINLFNDVSDWRLGADSKKLDSWVRIHNENTLQATWHGIISFLAGGSLGIGVLVISDQLWILLFATPLVLLGYLYNAGSRPLSYTWMGEWVTGLCYGPGVFGCLWLVAGQEINSQAILGMVAFAALAMALLLSHQPPQVETDQLAGKRSFAVRYGASATYSTAKLLFLCTLISLGSGLALTVVNDWALLVYVVFAVSAAYMALMLTPNPRIIVGLSAFVLMASLIGQLAS